MTITRRFRKQHSRVILSDRRFKVLVAGRRWGKTLLALWLVVLCAAQGKNRHVYYIAPTRRQAKRIVWRELKNLIPLQARHATSETELRIELCNDSIIELHGASNAESLRGSGLDFVVLDEFASMRPEIWGEVVRPMLADRQGGALFIGTPKGFNHFYELYVTAQSRPEWVVFRFPTRDGGYVSDEELKLLQYEMDPRRFRQELEATFEAAQGRVYYAFTREDNVTELKCVPDAPLLVGMDFNISPMAAVIAQRAADECHVIDEIVLANSNTTEMMQELNRRYGPGRGIVHPDPSGSQRRTSAPVGRTDFALIGEAGWVVYEQTTPYPIIDRTNTVNSMLCNAQGRRRLLISPKCKQLIRGLEGLTYKEGGKFIDKSSGFDHITDALGYLIMGVFPMVRNTVTVHPVF